MDAGAALGGLRDARPSKVRGSGPRMLTDIVSLVRFALDQDDELVPYPSSVERAVRRLAPQQEQRRRRLHPRAAALARAHPRPHRRIASAITADDFDYAPFVEHGGLGKAFEVFGIELRPLLEELNESAGSVSDLPDGWAWTSVAGVGELRLGRQRSPKWHTGPNMRPYLRVANVFEDRIDVSDVKSMHFEPHEVAIFELRSGDVLLNEGQTPELLGRPAIYRDELPGSCFTNSLIRLRPHPGILSKWALIVFRHYLHSGRFKRESQITTNIAHLSLGRLSPIEFPVPPSAEQERIVAAVEEHWSHLDAGVESLERASRNLARLRSLTYSRLLSDEHWPWTTLGEIAEIVGGVTKDAKRQGDPAFVELPYLRVANVQRGYLNLQEVSTIRVPPEKGKALELLPGDILFNEGGDRDKNRERLGLGRTG